MKRFVFLALITLVIGFLATFATMEVVRHSALRHDHQRFDRLADKVQSEYQRRMKENELGLIAVQCLFSARERVEFDEFNQLIQRIRMKDDVLDAAAFGYLEVVPDTPDAIQAFKEELADYDLPSWKVFTPSDAGVEGQIPSEAALVPGRFLIKFIESDTRYSHLIGLDMSTEKVRRATAELAARTGDACISPRLQLVSDAPDAAGFLWFVPHYHGNPSNEEERLANILGWVGMAVDTESLFGGLDAITEGELGYKLSIVEEDGRAFQLIASASKPNADFPRMKRTLLEKSGKQVWRIDVYPTSRFSTTVPSTVWAVGLGGGCCTLLVSALVLLLGVSAYRARKMADRMTLDLRRLAMVAKRTTNGVIITDNERRITWVNEGFTRITGYTLEEVVGKVPGRILQCEQTDSNTVNQIRSALNAKEGFCGELLNKKKDGTLYWVYLDIQPLYDDEGYMLGYLSIENDVSDSRLAAEGLERANRRTQYALDGGKMSLWDWDIESGIVTYDSRCESITGHTSDPDGDKIEVWFDRIYRGDLAEVKRNIDRCIAGETEYFEIEWRCLLEDGNYNWLFARGQALSRDENGVATVMAGTTMEINERKRVELALVESEKRSQAIFKTSQDGFLFLRGAEIVDCNPRALEMYGFDSVEEISGTNVVSLSPEYQPGGELSEVLGHQLIEKIHEKGALHFEWTHRSKDGRTFECDISVAAFRLSGEEYMQAVVRDISSKNQMRRQLSQTQKLESIGQLAAGVAHEINTPMQCVFGNVEYLSSAVEKVFSLTEAYRKVGGVGEQIVNDDETIRMAEKKCRFDDLKIDISESIEEAHDASNRVIEIVRAMKTMSHPGSAAKQLTNLNQLVHDATTVARNHWKYVAELEFQLDDTIDLLPMYAAPMSQVILNLVVNSADAIGEKVGKEPDELGKITVSTVNEGDHVCIKVRDSGDGMPEDVRRRVFDPFFTTKEVGKGTGQGLAIAYDVVVNQHHGSIQVDSTPSQGTCFTVRLPTNQETSENAMIGAPVSNSTDAGPLNPTLIS
ncbi:PAS domain S-box protein [Rhodopirellula sp. JC740]|uniref:histidine kinase n=1 Tax=Rhodopirellula halodulae TaxID=2894198 RepID=A0ABS8NN94_9BACT|nr:PAS domain S-box protein [Rhodopirellula sp. JC740]MCC9645059.1 PAS domain S-box protein [Rhodopirellula sp. JC740]